MNDQLCNAYLYHRAYGQHATLAVKLARADVDMSKRRYPNRGRPYQGTWQQEHGRYFLGLGKHRQNAFRYIGNVLPHDCRNSSLWARDSSTGWYINPYGETCRDLCWGVVYQLTGRNGRARFVA